MKNEKMPEIPQKDGWVDITPEMATLFLLHSARDQRKVKWSVVNQYAQDMKKGLWRANGEPIHFNKEGKMVNGQHRCHAIIESKTTIRAYVICNVEETLFDVGYRRNTKDQLAIQGIELPAAASAAVKIVLGEFTKPVGVGTLNQYIEKHLQDLERAYKACCVGTAGKLSKRASCVAATYLMLNTNTAQYFQMEMFWQVYNTKEVRLAGANDASAVLIAREQMEAAQENRLRRFELEVIICAMEDFLAGTHREEMYKLEEPYHWTKYMQLLKSQQP